MTAIQRVTVLGAGSWGTVFAKVLADAGRDVVLWARRARIARAVDSAHCNPDYLPGLTLPTTLSATTDPALALDGAQAVVFAVPSQSLRDNLAGWRAHLPPSATLLSLAKGVELRSLKRMSEVIVEATGAGRERVAVVSGPNLAAEIAQAQPTATVIACCDHERAVTVQQACVTPYFRPYTNTDVVGCEIGGACKNVIALACGVAAGLGYGHNSQASLMTRGLAETARLGAALGAAAMTFAGLAGLGDLVATCSSPLSRNRAFGERLGRGGTVARAQEAAHGQVAEGVRSCSSLRALAARCGVDMPITEGVHRICREGQPVAELAAELLGREHKAE